jgi:undecaprenyl-diphosphatase
VNDWINALILGIIEGLTEFIPVSSTGHLLLAKTFMGLPDGFWDTFAVLIQFGAILGVVALYFGRLWKVLVGLPSDPGARWFAFSVVLAFVPSAVIGFALHDFIKQVLFESPRVICWSLILGGVVLFGIDRWAPKPTQHDAMKLGWVTAVMIGVAQTLAMVPGVSRSGATIVGAMLMRVEKRAAAEFSFFLAIPTMAGATALDAWKSRHDIDMSHAGIIAFGFVVSFVVGYIVVRQMLDFVARHGFAPFAWWRIVVGVGGLVGLSLVGR